MVDRSRAARLAVAIAVLIALGGLTYIWWSALGPGPAPGDPTMELRIVRGGLSWPVAIAFAPDTRVFYAERLSGRIHILGNATSPENTLFYTIPEVAASGGDERGLLGLAIDPDFADQPYVYAYYTRADDANGSVYNRIVRIRANGSLGEAMEVLKDRIAAASFHNGGVIAFGPDGKLYAVVGDAGARGSAQDVSTPNGKILRLNPNGSVPADNPFVNEAGSDGHVFTYGHRNMFGIAFQPESGRAYATENGPNCNDEVNRLESGRNFGWGPTESCSASPTPQNTNRDGPDPVLPITWYNPVIAPTNAAFYTAAVPASARGHLVFGGFNDRALHELTLAPDGASVLNESILATAEAGILDVEVGLDGFLWITTSSGIYRLVPKEIPPETSYAPAGWVVAGAAFASKIGAPGAWRDAYTEDLPRKP